MWRRFKNDKPSLCNFPRQPNAIKHYNMPRCRRSSMVPGLSFIHWNSYVSELRRSENCRSLWYRRIHLLKMMTLNGLANRTRHGQRCQYDRDNFAYAPSQWETTLHCNVVSHWLGVYAKWSLVGYETLSSTVWHHSRVIGCSKYSLGYRSVVMYYGPAPSLFKGHWQSSCAASILVVRAVQRDYERV